MSLYHEGNHYIKFYREFGGSDRVVAIVHVPDIREWGDKTGFSLAQRDEIIGRIAEEVIKQKAPNCTYSFEQNRLHIEEPKERA